MLVTALAFNNRLYKAASIAKELFNNTTLKDEIIKSGLMNEKQYHKVVDLKNGSTKDG